MGSNTTFHAIEHAHLQLGSGVTYGDTTVSGNNLKLGDGAIFFRARGR